MGHPGVKSGITKEQIIQSIKKSGGRVSHAARLLDHEPRWLYNKLNADPDLWEVVHEQRKVNDEINLDIAEETLMHAINQKEKELANSIKAVFFLLNNKGRARGYNPLQKQESYDAKDVERVDRMMRLIENEQKARLHQSSESSEKNDNIK